MKNKKKEKHIKLILTILIKDYLINIYHGLVQRFRFSIAFKLNMVYIWLFISLLITLNIFLSICAAIYIGKNIYNGMLQDYNLISTYLETNKELPQNKLDTIFDVSSCDIILYKNENSIIYINENNRIGIYDESKIQNGVYKISDDIVIINNEVVRKTTGDVLNFYLVFHKSLMWNGENVVVQLNKNLTKDYLPLINVIKLLLFIDLLLLLSIIKRGAKSSRRMLKPIDDMTETVKNITVNALDTRLNVSGSKDELKDLASTFNNMLDRIQRSYDAQNQFVSDASHELRTPIAVIQGYVNMLDRWGKNDESVLNESIEAIKSETESMKKLVENLLFLARGDKKTQRVDMEKLQLNIIIEELYKETKLIDANHDIVCNVNEEITLTGDRKLLKEAFRIFIDNAIKYTPLGGRITLSSKKILSQVEITVEDTGIGISKEDLPNIFNRFYRADKSRTKDTGGTGLGLSIAKWIIMTHRGSIKIESSLNRGTKIIIILPLSQ